MGCLYNIDMSLVNIRISAEEKKMAADLRAQGIKMSDLFRRVLKEEHDRRCKRRKSKRSAREIIEELDRKFPLTATESFHGIDTANRHELRKYIQEQMRLRRSKR
jgi:hypothetical protein